MPDYLVLAQLDNRETRDQPQFFTAAPGELEAAMASPFTGDCLVYDLSGGVPVSVARDDMILGDDGTRTLRKPPEEIAAVTGE